jgi:hypothetical protein
MVFIKKELSNMNLKKCFRNLFNGWLPKEPNNMKRAMSHHSFTSKGVVIFLTFVLVCLLSTAAVFLFANLFSNGEADGWDTSRVIERISFPGGDIVVQENSQSPTDKGYITVYTEANVTSKENLDAYVTSRNNALNTILDTASIGSQIEAVVTLKTPISPQAFASLCETSIVKCGEYAIVLTNKASGMQSSEAVWFPRPQEAGFVQNLTSTHEDSKLEGIVAFECYLEPEQARSVQSDPRVLLVDPLEDQQLLEVKERYESAGFNVQLGRVAFFEEMWTQYLKLKENTSEGA